MFIPTIRKQRNRIVHDLIQSTGQQAFHLALQYMNDRDGAKDMVQQASLKALEIRQLPQEGLSFWFLKIVRNLCIDQLRHVSVKLQKESELIAHNELKTSDAYINSYEQQEETSAVCAQVHAGLKLLSIEHREIIILKDLYDYSYEQIANILDLNKGTVMSRLHRARLALKKEVEQYVQ